MPQVQEQYFTPQEVADQYKISKMSVLRAFKNGDLKGIKINERIIRFTQRQIDHWAKNK